LTNCIYKSNYFVKKVFEPYKIKLAKSKYSIALLLLSGFVSKKFRSTLDLFYETIFPRDFPIQNALTGQIQKSVSSVSATIAEEQKVCS